MPALVKALDGLKFVEGVTRGRGVAREAVQLPDVQVTPEGLFADGVSGRTCQTPSEDGFSSQPVSFVHVEAWEKRGSSKIERKSSLICRSPTRE